MMIASAAVSFLQTLVLSASAGWTFLMQEVWIPDQIHEFALLGSVKLIFNEFLRSYTQLLLGFE